VAEDTSFVRVGATDGVSVGNADLTSPGAIFTSEKVTTALEASGQVERAWKKLSAVREFSWSTTVRMAPFEDAGTEMMCVPPSKDKPNRRSLEAHVDDTVTCNVQVAPSTQFSLDLRVASSVERNTVPPCRFKNASGYKLDGK
jgi:hypothetical protein